ncbi:MAG: lipopolysaccharide assembly protein LapA domain-containing protein [Alphaproteobacteria bacterium]|nr:lipopolysaccharide assembly protein LapA domain-containing protein [Alphaproteobacteria bacterium]
MRKFLAIAVLVPLAIVIVMFAVANREIITVSFDPFDSAQPAFALKLPLFVLIFVLVGLGVLVGGIPAWLRQQKWRTRARRAESEARDLRGRLASAEPRRNVPALVEASPPFAVPPAA